MKKTMKAQNIPLSTLLLATGLLAAAPVCAATYTDAVGDFTGGVGALDLTSVSVNNDGTSVTFTLNLAGDPTAATWYNYYIGISENLYGGVGGNLNGSGGWGKDIQMSNGGMDYFVGAYPAYAGYSLLTWSGSAWNTTTATASQNSTSVTIPVSLAALGLAPGSSFTFDVWTSDSGSDYVLDALSDGTSRSWNSVAFDTGANGLSYTVQAVPEPATILGLGIAAGIAFRRRGSAQS